MNAAPRLAIDKAIEEDDTLFDNEAFMNSVNRYEDRQYHFVSRKQWRAAKPRKTRDLEMYHPITYVVVNYHWGEQRCLDRESCKEFLQDEQRRLMRACDEDDIPFHFLVGDDGTVYEGRGWRAAGKKTIHHWNFEHLGFDKIDITYIGNYEDADDLGRLELLRPVMNLVGHAVVLGYVSRHWALEEWPLMRDEINQWPPKNKGPKPPRLWMDL